MHRIEIIANKSVEEDITDTLEEVIPEFLYTKIPLAYGRGKKDRKLGTPTWPETNFILIAYIEDDWLKKARAVLDAVKKKFPEEGIKFFAIRES